MSNKAGSLQKLEQWIMNLPRTLWELGDTDVPCTEVVVLALDNHQILMAMSQGNSTLSFAAISASFSAGANRCKYFFASPVVAYLLLAL
jgi:hypothetical protein